MNLENLKLNFVLVHGTIEQLLTLSPKEREALYKDSENKVMDDIILEQYLQFTELVLEEERKFSDTQDDAEIIRILHAYQEVIFDMLSFFRVEIKDELTARMNESHLQLQAYKL